MVPSNWVNMHERCCNFFMVKPKCIKISENVDLLPYSERQQLQLPVFLSKYLQALLTWIWAVYPIVPGRSSQAPSDWMEGVCELLSSGLCTDVLWGLSLGFGWATQGQSETCPKATLALSWLYALGHCHAER